MRRVPISLLLFICVAGAQSLRPDRIDAFGFTWHVPVAADWKVETKEGNPVLELLVPRPALQPRRPTQYAVAATPNFLRGVVELEMKKEPEAARKRRTSLMIAYAWQDDNHFNYVHLSVDAASEQVVHNGVFHVYGGERVRISPRTGPATLPDEQWHKVKLVYDGTTGLVEVYVDGKTSPSMRAVDMSLGAGKFGIGSFFDMGSFRNVKITGTAVN
ncbi:MAG TPA: hypothetical protein VFB63_11710 [Bryobacteraceae bacterium]|nr:hypothetical protein [Bryobacteraceae bacterium]